MPRFNITMPQELWDRVGEAAPEGNRSWFIRRALEAALGDRPERADEASGPEGGGATPSNSASPRASEPMLIVDDKGVSREVETRAAFTVQPRPSRTCGTCGKVFGSPTLRRCTICNGKVLPEPA
jgi:hypothetical protein